MSTYRVTHVGTTWGVHRDEDILPLAHCANQEAALCVAYALALRDTMAETVLAVDDLLTARGQVTIAAELERQGVPRAALFSGVDDGC